MKKVLTIGGATQDVFIQYQPQESMRLHTESPGHCFLMIEEGQKIEVSDLLYHTGGGATNAAVSFQKLGFDATAFFKIARDTPGDFILHELKKFNIKTVPVISHKWSNRHCIYHSLHIRRTHHIRTSWHQYESI